MRIPSKWDKRFLGLAEYVSNWSKDPSTKVGAVIVDHYHRIVSTGYNGLPTRVVDRPEVLLDRSIKLERVIHAEVNAILFARQQLHACTLYTWPFPPCSRCASVVVQSGIARVVAPRVNADHHWWGSVQAALDTFLQANVSVDWYTEGDLTNV